MTMPTVDYEDVVRIAYAAGRYDDLATSGDHWSNYFQKIDFSKFYDVQNFYFKTPKGKVEIWNICCSLQNLLNMNPLDCLDNVGQKVKDYMDLALHMAKAEYMEAYEKFCLLYSTSWFSQLHKLEPSPSRNRVNVAHEIAQDLLNHYMKAEKTRFKIFTYQNTASVIPDDSKKSEDIKLPVYVTAQARNFWIIHPVVYKNNAYAGFGVLSPKTWQIQMIKSLEHDSVTGRYLNIHTCDIAKGCYPNEYLALKDFCIQYAQFLVDLLTQKYSDEEVLALREMYHAEKNNGYFSGTGYLWACERLEDKTSD